MVHSESGNPGTLSQTHSLGQSLALASRVVARVLEGASSTEALIQTRAQPANLRAAAHDLSFNALRAYGLVDSLADTLLDRPATDPLLRGLIYVALVELVAQTEDQPRGIHAVVHQAVEAANLLGLSRAKGLVNAILRAFLRDSRALIADARSRDAGRWNHPKWWIERLKHAYPDSWEAILSVSNMHPPMCLRSNIRKQPAEKYLSRLAEAGIAARRLTGQAILLEAPCRVEALPGFAAGDVSVQDAGAQLAAQLLDVRPGLRVLDACAAPGGKSAHILELEDCELFAMDNSAKRVRRIEENLARLNLKAEVRIGDATKATDMFPAASFDRVLADVPCTASGVVRRHPDMRWLRRESDIESFAAMQARILDALWQVLVPDGKLLYATCSVFPDENGLQVQGFLGRHEDAELLPVTVGMDGQILPTPECDGFYYALLHKRP